MMKASEEGGTGAVRASGPGEIYEIDSTQGRLYLVSSSDPDVIVGKPTIYLLIDRWSRHVVAVYLSLSPPSFEELKYALLIAFTPRLARFSNLGVDVSEDRWPRGRIPAVICPDRGSDFMSNSAKQIIVNDLRIELTPLPPACPDGKAIVERFIREVKQKIFNSKVKGAYKEGIADRDTKKAAKAAAVHTLAGTSRKLVEIIDAHNNTPHRTLRKRRILTQAGIEPTPKNAYLWGIR